MSKMRQPIVAIDGPAGSGKSTVAQAVAREAGLQFISSGAMYRAVALRAMREGVPATDRERLIALAAELDMHFTTDESGIVHAFLSNEDVTDALSNPAVGSIASVVAVIPELRAFLVAKQRDYGIHGGIVMEGRDIQTVVFPDADIKIFLVASANERACRRWKELKARGETVSFDTVLQEVKARDARDTEREASPLRAAPDAVTVDTDGRTVAQVVDCILRVVGAWRQNPRLRGKDLARAAGINTAGPTSGRTCDFKGGMR